MKTVMMKIAILLTTILLQIGLGYVLGFKTVDWFRIGSSGNNMELIALPVGYALGVWLMGAISTSIQKKRFDFSLFIILIGTLLCTGIALYPLLAVEYPNTNALFYPLGGAIIGYYVTKVGIDLVL